MGVKVTFLRDDERDDVATPLDSARGRAVALVPKTAIRAEGNQSYAFVVSSDGVVDRRAVSVGGADGDRVAVIAGLTAGEQVVLSPPPELAGGARVVVE